MFVGACVCVCVVWMCVGGGEDRSVCVLCVGGVGHWRWAPVASTRVYPIPNLYPINVRWCQRGHIKN